MEYTKEFEEWWKKNNGLSAELPIAVRCFKEIAFKAWKAALDMPILLNSKN